MSTVTDRKYTRITEQPAVVQYHTPLTTELSAILTLARWVTWNANSSPLVDYKKIQTTQTIQIV